MIESTTQITTSSNVRVRIDVELEDYYRIKDAKKNQN